MRRAAVASARRSEGAQALSRYHFETVPSGEITVVLIECTICAPLPVKYKPKKFATSLSSAGGAATNSQRSKSGPPAIGRIVSA